MDISEQDFENIQFDSINFSEVHGNSILSIDITNLFEKYLDDSKDTTNSSSIIELGSISQNSTPKPNSKTFININNTKFSPNLENYNAFEDELNNLKTQEITNSKIPNETSFIENSSFINAESINISKKILVGINNIEINPNIKIESLENKNTIEKEKCESIKSKKSVLSKKSHKSEKDQNNEEAVDVDNENESLDNSYVNVNDEKTLINKSLKPASLNGYSSIQEINSENNQELCNIPTSHNEIEKADKIHIVTHTEDEKPESPVTKDKFTTSTINNDTHSSIISSSKDNQQNKSDEELSISSYEESISNVGAKIDPIDTNDDSMSSLDIGEVNSIQDEEDSIDYVSEDHYESNPQSQTFIILKNNKPIGDIELIITPSSDGTKESSKIIDEHIAKVEIIENKTNIIDKNRIPSAEYIKPITKIESIENIENKTDVKIEETEKSSSEIIEPITKVESIENIGNKTEVKIEEIEKPSSKVIEPITNFENIENDVKVEEIEESTTESIEQLDEIENIENKIDVQVEEIEESTTESIEQLDEIENIENKIDVQVEETKKPSSEIIESVADDENIENKIVAKVEESEKSSHEIIEPVTEIENVENKTDVKVEETEKPTTESIEQLDEVENIENKIDVQVEETKKPSSEIIESVADVENIESKIDIKVEESRKSSHEIIEPVTEIENVENKTDVKVEETEKPTTESIEQLDEVENIENKIDVQVEETKKPSSEIIESVADVENIESKIDIKVEESRKSSHEIIESVTEIENVENKTDVKVEETEKPTTESIEQLDEVENIENKVDVQVEETKKPSSEIIESVADVENIESKIDIKVEESRKSSHEIIEPVTEIENVKNKTDKTEKQSENLRLNEPNIEIIELQTESNIISDNKKSEIDDKKIQMEMIEEKIHAIQTSIENDITNVKPPLDEIIETPSESRKSTFNDEVNDIKDENKPKLKLNKRTSSLNLHIKKRKESISSKANYNSSKASKHNKKKKIKQSINEEIESIANEIDNDTIKEKFNNYIEKRNSLQSVASSNSSNSKTSSALSAYILNNENSELPNDEFENDAEKYKSNTQSSKLTLNIDTSISKIHSYKEDHTPDKERPSVTPSSLTPSQLRNHLRSSTPTGLSNSYNHNILPSPSGTSSSDSLHEQCISPTPSEDSTISNGSHSYSIGKISRHKQFEVVYDHKPQLPDEIPLRKGDIVQVKQVFEDGWAYGIIKKKHLDGIFPIQCLGEEFEPSRNGRMVPRLVRVYQARLEDEEQERQEEEEFKKKVTDQARKNVLLKLALSHPK
ncbi:hypothetical protein H8356DRAFT_931668 [Neocallimastix lanati (nom. inval.)]|nr:hypothetical protein H8356DRAFT_931668 [Neocallimastix sp. JGI-2020a]